MTAQAAFGTIKITKHNDPEADPRWWITVDHADPRILISHQLLEMIQRGECEPWEPWARIEKTCACFPDEVQAMCTHYQGARLEITARNRRLVYVIGALDPASWPYWPAEWPD